MPLYTAHTNLTSVGDDRATARRRFDAFVRQLVDEGLIVGYTIDEPGDMEQDLEGPAIWMSEVVIEFESDCVWPDETRSDEEFDALLEPLQRQLARIQARMAELLEEDEAVDYDTFNQRELTLEDLEPVASGAHTMPQFVARGTMRTSACMSPDARRRFEHVLSDWQAEGYISGFDVDQEAGGFDADDPEERPYGEIRVYVGLAHRSFGGDPVAAVRELLERRRELLEHRAAQADVEFLGWDEISPL